MTEENKESEIEKKLKEKITELETKYQELFEFAKDMIGYIPDYQTRFNVTKSLDEYRLKK